MRTAEIVPLELTHRLRAACDSALGRSCHTHFHFLLMLDPLLCSDLKVALLGSRDDGRDGKAELQGL